MKSKKIFYFLGNLPSQITHALPLYKEIKGEFIVLSKKTKYFCKQKGVKIKMLDNYPKGYLNLDYSKILNTINYLNNQEGVIFFFHTFNIIDKLKSLKKIMLFHGNSLKDYYFEDWRVARLNKFDYITSLGPHWENIMQKKGVNPKKFIRIGQTRCDEIIKNAGAIKNQELIFKKMGLKNKKIISYMPTWYGPTSVNDVGKEIIKRISDKYILLFRPHPDTPNKIIKKYESLISKKRNVLYVPENKFKDINLSTLFIISNSFIVDMGSVLIDIILTDKPMIFAFRKNQFELTKEKYKPIREIFEKSKKIDLDNVYKINEIIENALNEKVDNNARDIAKKRIFYNLEGDATIKLIKFIKNNIGLL